MPVDEQEALRIFHDVGAVLEGHFIFASRLHGAHYVNKDALYPHTMQTEALCYALAERVRDVGAEVVVGPASGGIILSHLVARHLSMLTGREVLSISAHRYSLSPSSVDVALDIPVSGFELRPTYQKLVVGRPVLVVDDVLTSGQTTREVVECVRRSSGIVLSVAVLWNRGEITTRGVSNVPNLTALVNLKLDAWDMAECARTGPCSRGVPINTEVGRG